MSLIRRCALVVALVASLGVGCSQGGDSGAIAPSTRISTTLGPRTSQLTFVTRFHVPLMAGARASDTGSSPIYFYGADITKGVLQSFYDRLMPRGRPWGGLDWCEGVDFASGSVPIQRRSWRVPGTDDFLVVDIGGAEHGHGASVLISDDPDDPAPCASDSPE